MTEPNFTIVANDIFYSERMALTKSVTIDSKVILIWSPRFYTRRTMPSITSPPTETQPTPLLSKPSPCKTNGTTISKTMD